MSSIISFFFGNNTNYPYATPMADGDISVLPTNTALPTISGTAQVGQTLTCAPGTWTYILTLTYQWQQSGTDISGATGATYVPVSGDVGHTLDCVVTGADLKGSVPATSAATATVTAGGVSVPVNSTLPVISGTVAVGSVLSATNGTWTNTPTSYTYQWAAGGSNIGGATANAYTLLHAQAGATITCAVVAINAGGSSSPATSTATAAVTEAPSNTAAPVISGLLSVGHLLSTTDGTWNGYPAPTITYQWKNNGTPIGGATSNTYTTVSGDIGATITCVVTATNSSSSANDVSNGLGPITSGGGSTQTSFYYLGF
jgi:hypothetical protein